MRTIFWAVVNLLQNVYAVLCTSFWIFAALIVRALTGGTRLPLLMAHHCWAPMLMWPGFSRLEVRGLEKVDFSRPHFFACNHQSIVDVPLMYRVLPTPLIFILKEELRRVPILGWYIVAMGMILVPRRERLRSLKNLQRCRQRMEEGTSILMFPEGTRSRDGRVHDFKPGVFVPAIELGAPVVPVAIDGTGAIVPPGKSFRWRPGRMRVTIGEPIPTAGLSREDRRELARRVRERVEALQRARPEG